MKKWQILYLEKEIENMSLIHHVITDRDAFQDYYILSQDA